MTSKISWIFFLFVFIGTTHAVEKRIIEPNHDAQGFQQTVFQALEHYESHSENISLETNRRGLKTYTLLVRFENPEQTGENNNLLGERIECRQERRGNETTIWYHCRFEVFNAPFMNAALFYNEGIRHIFSNAIRSLYREVGQQEGRLEAGISRDFFMVEAVGSGNRVICQVTRRNRPSLNNCQFRIKYNPDPETTQATFESIKAREPWLNYLEESFVLSDLELNSIELYIWSTGRFRLTAIYTPTEFSNQNGKRVQLEGLYENSNFVDTSRYNRLEIVDIEG